MGKTIGVVAAVVFALLVTLYVVFVILWNAGGGHT